MFPKDLFKIVAESICAIAFCCNEFASPNPSCFFRMSKPSSITRALGSLPPNAALKVSSVIVISLSEIKPFILLVIFSMNLSIGLFSFCNGSKILANFSWLNIGLPITLNM